MIAVVAVLLTPAHDGVLALLDWLPGDTEAAAILVADLLGVTEAEAAQLGYVTRATGPVQ